MAGHKAGEVTQQILSSAESQTSKSLPCSHANRNVQVSVGYDADRSDTVSALPGMGKK